MRNGDTVVLDRLLDPLANSLNKEAAQVIADFRADATTQARIDELAEKCSAGLLTPEEREEYEEYVEAIDTVAILQDKDRKALNHHSTS